MDWFNSSTAQVLSLAAAILIFCYSPCERRLIFCTISTAPISCCRYPIDLGNFLVVSSRLCSSFPVFSLHSEMSDCIHLTSPSVAEPSGQLLHIMEFLGVSKIVLRLIMFEDVSINLATSVSDLLGNLRNLTKGYEVIPFFPWLAVLSFPGFVPCSSGLARFLGLCW